jgi:hypothetical protein
MRPAASDSLPRQLLTVGFVGSIPSVYVWLSFQHATSWSLDQPASAGSMPAQQRRVHDLQRQAQRVARRGGGSAAPWLAQWLPQPVLARAFAVLLPANVINLLAQPDSTGSGGKTQKPREGKAS